MSILDDFRVAMKLLPDRPVSESQDRMVLVSRNTYTALVDRFGRHPTADEYYLWLREQCGEGGGCE